MVLRVSTERGEFCRLEAAGVREFSSPRVWNLPGTTGLTSPVTDIVTLAASKAHIPRQSLSRNQERACGMAYLWCRRGCFPRRLDATPEFSTTEIIPDDSPSEPLAPLPLVVRIPSAPSTANPSPRSTGTNRSPRSGR